jgi:gluconate kinase
MFHMKKLVLPVKTDDPTWLLHGWHYNNRTPTASEKGIMDRCLLILFGLPGAGKTAAGLILAREFGFDFVDADDLLTDDLRQRLQHPVSEADAEAARDAWYERILAVLAARLALNRRVAFAQALVQQKHRNLLRSHFPFARFLLIEANEATVAERLAGRDHFLPPERGAALRDLFEPVDTPHTVIANGGDLRQLWQRLATFIKDSGCS